MAEIKIKTGKARQTHRRPMIVGYRWKGDREYEVLSCGHDRLIEGELDDWTDFASEDYTDEDVVTSMLAAEPIRRVCAECPIPHRGLSTP